jgi:hypothetical protein
MIYLVVGVDRRTFRPYHENVSAPDAGAAGEIARAGAHRNGLDLVVAAVVGPNSTVLGAPAPGMWRAA